MTKLCFLCGAARWHQLSQLHARHEIVRIKLQRCAVAIHSTTLPTGSPPCTDRQPKRREHRRLDSLLAYCEASQCRRVTLLTYFGEIIRPMTKGDLSSAD